MADSLAEAAVEVVADTSKFTRGLRQRLERAASEASGRISGIFERDLSSARRGLGSFVSALGGLVTAGLRLTVVAGAFSTLAAGAASAVVPIIQLGTALAPLAGLLAALPALGAAAVAAIAPLAVAFIGVGDAISAAVTGDAEEFAEAIQGLALPAREVAREVRALAPDLKELQRTVQGAFFEPLVGQVERLGAALIGPLRVGMSRVAAVLGQSTANLARFAAGQGSVNAIRQIFDDVAVAIDNASVGLVPLAAAFRDVAAAITPQFRDLGTVIGGLATELATFLQDAAASGAVFDWVTEGTVTLQTLGTILANVGAILRAVFSTGVSDGLGLLGVIAEATTRFREFLESTAGAGALVGIFSGLSAVGSALAPVIQALLIAFGQLAPIIGQLAIAFGPVLTAAITAVVPALTSIGTAMQTVIGALGQAVTTLVASGALNLLGQTIGQLLVALVPLLPAIGQLVAALIGVLPALLPLIGPLVAFAAILGTQLAGVITALVPGIRAIAVVLGAVLVAVTPLLPALGQLLVTVGTALAQALTEITPDLVELAASLGQVLIALIPLFPPLAQIIVILLRFAAAILGPAIRAINAIIGVLAPLIVNTVRVIAVFLRLVAAIAGPVLGVIGRLIAGILRAIATFARLVATVISSTNSIRSRIVGALGNLGQLLFNAGRSVIQGLINGIRSMLGALGNAASSAARTIRDRLPFSPARTGPLSGRGDPELAGQRIAELLAEGMVDQVATVAAAAETLARRTLDSFSGPVLPTDRVAASVGSVLASRPDAAAAPPAGPPGVEVRVFIGDQELKGMVRTEVSERDRGLRRRVTAGTGGTR